MLNYTVKPIIQWPGELHKPKHRRANPFNSPWGKTLNLLEREIRFLDGRNIIFQAAVRESDVRLDGGIKANARPAEHPGVIITFDSKHGPLSYHTDLYVDFQANVRAIALALEALRAVDRYAVNKQGSQYSGYKRLPAAGESTNGRVRITTEDGAAKFISDALNGEITADQVLNSAWLYETVYKLAARKLHPDNKDTGNDDLFVDLQDAAVILRKKHGLT